MHQKGTGAFHRKRDWAAVSGEDPMDKNEREVATARDEREALALPRPLVPGETQSGGGDAEIGEEIPVLAQLALAGR